MFHDDFPSPSSIPEWKALGRKGETATARVAEFTAGSAENADAASFRNLTLLLRLTSIQRRRDFPPLRRARSLT